MKMPKMFASLGLAALLFAGTAEGPNPQTAPVTLTTSQSVPAVPVAERNSNTVETPLVGAYPAANVMVPGELPGERVTPAPKVCRVEKVQLPVSVPPCVESNVMAFGMEVTPLISLMAPPSRYRPPVPSAPASATARTPPPTLVPPW